MKMYKYDGKEHIDDPIEVSLERAFKEVEKLPTGDGIYIGFINEKDETIQFIRFEENGWLIDVPISEEGTYSYSLQDDDLTTETVKGVIERFFRGEDWKSLCNLMSPESKLSDIDINTKISEEEMKSLDAEEIDDLKKWEDDKFLSRD